ncbi:MAG: hypothetical protein ACJ77K_05565 [Bacteroidia bacterium]
MKAKLQVRWTKKPDPDDYPSAQSYLSLIYSEQKAEKLVKKLKRARTIEFKAKDIFRACHLELLGINNYHVQKDSMKIKEGEKLSPILLVRSSEGNRVIVADGYHRLCAVYALDEDAEIPCRIV